MEELLDRESPQLRELAEFLELPPRAGLADSLDDRVDAVSRRTELDIEWREIHNHRQTVKLAASFGYSLDDIDGAALRRRYRWPLWLRLRPWLAKLRRRLVGHRQP
jgi:hypothetical protein